MYCLLREKSEICKVEVPQLRLEVEVFDGAMLKYNQIAESIKDLPKAISNFGEAFKLVALETFSSEFQASTNEFKTVCIDPHNLVMKFYKKCQKTCMRDSKAIKD